MISGAIAYARDQAISELIPDKDVGATGRRRSARRPGCPCGDDRSGEVRVTLAADLGFAFEIFATEAEAVTWLDRRG